MNADVKIFKSCEINESQEVYVLIDVETKSFASFVYQIAHPKHEDQQHFLGMEFIYELAKASNDDETKYILYDDVYILSKNLSTISFWPNYDCRLKDKLVTGELIVLQCQADNKVREKLIKMPDVFCLFTAFCLEYYYVILRLQKPFKNVAEHKKIFIYYAEYLYQKTNIGFNSDTPHYPHYLTYDPDIYFNPNSLLLPLDIEAK